MQNRNIQLLKVNIFQRIYLLSYGNGKCFIMKEALTEEQCRLLQHEAFLLSYLTDKYSFANCPKLIYTNNKNTIIESCVTGVELDSLTLDKNNSFFIMQSILENIISFQGVNLEGIKNECPQLVWRNYLFDRLRVYEDKIQNITDFDVNIFKPVIEFEYRIFDETIKNSPMVLLHNDLNASNILYNNENGLVSFIDFERWIIGDPIKEYSKLIWLLRKNKYMRRAFFNLKRNFLLDNDESLLLKAYFYFDILYHFSLFDRIKNMGNWPQFFAEEFLIVKNFNDNGLWRTE